MAFDKEFGFTVFFRDGTEVTYWRATMARREFDCSAFIRGRIDRVVGLQYKTRSAVRVVEPGSLRSGEMALEALEAYA